jgi:hypothetical protein
LRAALNQATARGYVNGNPKQGWHRAKADCRTSRIVTDEDENEDALI